MLQTSISRLERQDRDSTVKITSFVNDNFRSKKLFQTINHASNRLNLYMANRVLTLLECETVPEGALGAVTEIIERPTPVHPSIASYFGITYINAETRYPIDEVRNITFAEYIRDYVTYECGTLNYLDALVNNPGVAFVSKASQKTETADPAILEPAIDADKPAAAASQKSIPQINAAQYRNKALHRSASMPEVSYLDGHIVSCEDLKFHLNTPENVARAEADPTELFMFKTPGNIMVYEAVRRELGTARNIVELGIARGGSAVFVDVFFKPQRLVCLDLRPGVPPALEKYAAAGNDTIRAYPGVDQADQAKLKSILNEDFNGPLDLVIDDASHFYGPTKTSFEILFPRLRPLGIYVIEDWDWFHDISAQIPMHRAWLCLMFLTSLGDGLRWLLPMNDGFHQRYHLLSYVSYEATVDYAVFSGDQINRCDVLLCHPPDSVPFADRAGYRDFLEKFPPHTQKIFISWPRFAALWPFDVMAKPALPLPMYQPFWPEYQSDAAGSEPAVAATVRGEVPSFPFHDSYVMDRFHDGLSPADIVSNYLKLDVAAVVDLDKLAAQSLLDLEREERHADVKVADYVGTAFRDLKLFNTSSLASNRLILQIANATLKQLGLPPLSDAILEQLQVLIKIEAPIHPSIGRFFGAPYIGEETRYLVDRHRHLTFAEYLRGYVKLMTEISTRNVGETAVADKPPAPVGTATREAVVHSRIGKPLDEWILDHCNSDAYKARIKAVTESPGGLLSPASEVALICDLIEHLRPALAIEIGTSFGKTARPMAEALSRHNGKLITIDPYGGHRVPEIIAGWPQPLRDATDFRPIFSMELFARIEEKLFASEGPPKIGVAFVDGNHKFEYAFFDIMEAAENLSPGGAIVVDNLEQQGPRLAMRQFLRTNPAWKLYYHGRIWSGALLARDLGPPKNVQVEWCVLIAPVHLQVAANGRKFAGKLSQPEIITGVQLNLAVATAAPVEIEVNLLYTAWPLDHHITGKGVVGLRGDAAIEVKQGADTIDIAFDPPLRLPLQDAPRMNITYQLEISLRDEDSCVLLDAERPFEFKFAPSGE